MQTVPISPMLVQYLVALCCLRWDPEAVDVTIGDMVLDTAAKKERDVDVTVTVTESGSPTHAFKAYEVKREGAPLDVTEVEQLCLKLLDMPTITHRGIVSASGFTDGAQAKAAHHGVQLYVLQPWMRPLEEQFPLLTMKGTADQCFPMRKALLCWVQAQYSLVAPEATTGFSVEATDALFDKKGKVHRKYKSFGAYQAEVLLRSTDILFILEPATTVFRTFPIPFSALEGITAAGPAWPHTHTLAATQDDVYVKTHSGNVRVESITINGFLQWQRSADKALYYVIETITSGEAFAGALISPENREGNMTSLIFSPKTREIGIHFVRLAEKHNNMIRKLKLLLPEHAAEA